MATRSRRRKKNPLLMRILVISVVAHIIILPIAAHFGAFEKIRKQLGDSTVVMFTTPPVEAAEKPKAKPEEKAKKAAAGKKSHTGAKSASKSTTNLPQPKVVTGDAAAPGGEGGPSAESGNGAAGVLPTGPTKPATKPADTNPTPTPTPAPDKPKTEPVKTETAKTEPTPEPAKTAAPKPKRIVEATQTEAPEPTIPDELRTEPLDKTLYVEADVDTGGQPQNVKISKSTGIRELDDIGLETARKYRFRPATVDDVPVLQHVQFQIRFQVT